MGSARRETDNDDFTDRSHVKYDPEAPKDRTAYRHVAQPGDFWLENLQIEDFLVTIYQPDHFRPVSEPSLGLCHSSKLTFLDPYPQKVHFLDLQCRYQKIKKAMAVL